MYVMLIIIRSDVHTPKPAVRPGLRPFSNAVWVRTIKIGPNRMVSVRPNRIPSKMNDGFKFCSAWNTSRKINFFAYSKIDTVNFLAPPWLRNSHR